MTTTVMDNFLANSKAHTNTIWILILRPLNLSKQSEQLIHFTLLDPLSCVTYMHLELFFIVVVSCTNGDLATMGEFQRILSQVDKNLLESNLVSHKLHWQVTRAVFVIYLRLYITHISLMVTTGAKVVMITDSW